MLNTTDLLIAEAWRHGASLQIIDGRLKATPPDRLPAHLKAELRAAAAEVKAKLQAAETARIVQLDAERREADRQIARGYDLDCDAPSHADFLERTGQRCACQAPAHTIVATCDRFGVTLRIDADGALVVGKASAKADEAAQPWPSLLIAIEAHLEAATQLVASGWSLRADFPRQGS